MTTNRMPWMLNPKKCDALFTRCPQIWYQLCHNTYLPIGNYKHNNAINCKKFDIILFCIEWKWIKLCLCNNLVFRFGFASQIKHQNVGVFSKWLLLNSIEVFMNNITLRLLTHLPTFGTYYQLVTACISFLI